MTWQAEEPESTFLIFSFELLSATVMTDKWKQLVLKTSGFPMKARETLKVQRGGGAVDPSSGCQVITCFSPTQACSQHLLGLHGAFMGDGESSLPIPSPQSNKPV